MAARIMCGVRGRLVGHEAGVAGNSGVGAAWQAPKRAGRLVALSQTGAIGAALSAYYHWCSAISIQQWRAGCCRKASPGAARLVLREEPQFGRQRPPGGRFLRSFVASPALMSNVRKPNASTPLDLRPLVRKVLSAERRCLGRGLASVRMAGRGPRHCRGRTGLTAALGGSVFGTRPCERVGSEADPERTCRGAVSKILEREEQS